MKDYIQKIISLFTASDHSANVTKEVHQWLLDEKHADEKEAALHNLWITTEEKADASTWDSLKKVYQKVGVDRQLFKPKKTLQIWRYVSVAMLLFAISISGTFIFTKRMYSEVAMVEHLTPVGSMNTIKLPDGSLVQTNSGTLLLYPEIFKGNTRTVYLIGEANFKVKQNLDKPFVVRSTTMSITALGTEFNVNAYPEKSEIVATLIQGKVKVDCNNGKESYILNPGEQVVYERDSQVSALNNTVRLTDVTAWQKGVSVFRGVSVDEILTSLERRYAISFQYNANLFNDDKYNFRFPESSSLAEIMNVIQEVVGNFHYKQEGSICYIKAAQ